MKAWARAWDEIHAAWAAAAAEIAAASANGSWLTPGQIAHGERAQAALAAATEQIAALGQFTGVTVTDATGRIVEVTPEWQAHLIGSQIPAHAGTPAELVARFNRADPLSLSAIVQRTTQQITASTWTLSYTAAEQMRRTLIASVALGVNPRRTARRWSAAPRAPSMVASPGRSQSLARRPSMPTETPPPSRNARTATS